MKKMIAVRVPFELWAKIEQIKTKKKTSPDCPPEWKSMKQLICFLLKEKIREEKEKND